MAGSSDHTALHGLTVLIVEDEALVALELKQIVETAGGDVLGPTPTVDQALALIRTETPEIALLDVQLLNGMITPVAELLRTLGVPFVLLSGYTGPELQKPALTDVPKLSKPVSEHRLLAALAEAVRAR